jgi:hypothetical protein
MTESTIFALYSVWMFTTVRGWIGGQSRDFAVSGVLLGILCLTKASFTVLLPVAAALDLLCMRRIGKLPWRTTTIRTLVFVLAFSVVLGAWIERNTVSVGKAGLTEEYGAAALIERFAYDDMTPREFLRAFPYCVPGLGDWAFDHVNGTDAMHRFVYHTPGSFFNVGRLHREELLQQHGRLDPLIGGIVADELSTRLWRYILTSIPLAWCGMWPGWIVSLLLVPLFAWTCTRAAWRRELLFLAYTAPAAVMLALHAAIANNNTRYNLILIGPYAAGAAGIMLTAFRRWRWRWPA